MFQLKLFAVQALFFHVKYAQSLHCSEYLTENNLQLIYDYVSWRNIKSIIIVNESFDKSCDQNILKTYLKCFSKNDVFVSLRSSLTFSKRAENVACRKTVIVSLTDFANDNSTNFHNEVPKLALCRHNLAWLMIANEDEVVDKLRFTTLSLNADLVIAIHVSSSRFKAETSLLKENETESICSINSINRPHLKHEESIKTQFSQIVLTNVTPIKDVIDNKIITKFPNCNTTVSHSFCLLQLYKIRKELDASLVVHSLGTWNPINRTSSFSSFLPTEKRVNFHEFPLRFGKKNATQVTGTTENVTEDDSNEEKLIEIANYFEQFLNASGEIIYFQKLGHKENNREWTDLLRAVVTEEVDLGLDRIVKTPERYHDMVFSHKILTSMRDIYLKPQESNELRDIFLVPFGTRLILCVVATGIIFCIVRTFANGITNKIDEINGEKRNDTLGEASIWCIGIFSMQGSVWTPATYSGNIILITCLAFALVIFNSYSAFITSILSVEIVNIQSVDDLLASNYNIGYAKNSQDEIYLRSTNDTQLQQIYLRGYLHNTVSNVTELFFASVNIARKELQIINNYRCNYDIMEIPILKTKNTIAFPLSKNSPYRKIINLSIIKMYETGIYKYVHSLIVPDLPQCNKRRIFRSASLPDLTSAFGILFGGIQFSIVILVGECLWKRKQKLYSAVMKTVFSKHHLLCSHDQSSSHMG